MLSYVQSHRALWRLQTDHTRMQMPITVASFKFAYFLRHH